LTTRDGEEKKEDMEKQRTQHGLKQRKEEMEKKTFPRL
jgi:hypothetical protein